MNGNADKGQEAVPKVVRVTNLEQLRALVSKPVLARVFIGGEVVEIPCQRLTPAEADQVRQVFDRALPPVVQEQGQAPTFDLSNPEYHKAKAEAEADGRALAVWLGCEFYRGGQPANSLTDLAKIRAHCETQLSNDVYRAVFATITGTDATVGEYASFSSAAG